jgi:hypothetical protein
VRARSAPVVALLVAAAGVAACAPSVTPVTSSPPRTAPAGATAAPSPSPTASLASCPPARSFSSLTVLARVSGADDLATAADGSLWVSDAASHLEHLDAAGAVLTRLTDPREPEGMVPLTGGDLVVAEQGPDRIVELTPAGGSERTLLQLTPVSGQLGVDGIGWDAAAGDALVPDSPNGTLLAVSLASGAVTRLASGLGRPVDAAVVPGRGFAVTAENVPGLLIVPPGGGAATRLGSVSDADDVVDAGGLLYVTLLGAEQVVAVDPVTGASMVLVTRVGAPQGLTVLRDGRLAVADSTTGDIATFAAC